MNPELVKKYSPFQPVNLPNRTWPEKKIIKAPIWCSVDLRDGNQALIQPMSLEKKLEMFALLTHIGFKEIEVGFPSASQVEYDFTRMLIEKNLIPEGVLIQVLTQARGSLIRKTFESLKGAKEAVVHL
ncbi:MAG: 2-isopropylmalate synthase, partial [Proteobacteria bacterium]|nr:2-isopropylmalate synthase [Pseudomonadota bacterium]